ncbi:MAG: tripartite tricarboxylate transporter TctB family protein [Desulfatiglandales bacterium]
MRVNDNVIGLASVLLGVSIFCLTLNFPSLEGGHPGPALLPRILAFLFVAFGIPLIIKGINARRLRIDTQKSLPGSGLALNAICVIASVILYIVLVEKLGYIITNFFLLTILTKILGVRILTSLAFSFALTMGVYILFHRVLLVPLPWGLIPW